MGAGPFGSGLDALTGCTLSGLGGASLCAPALGPGPGAGGASFGLVYAANSAMFLHRSTASLICAAWSRLQMKARRYRVTGVSDLEQLRELGDTLKAGQNNTCDFRVVYVQRR